MTFNIQEAKKAIIAFLNQKNISFEQYNFDSGCSMIDLRIKDLFYAIQIEHDSVGFSLVEDNDFSSVPNERFYELSSFFIRLEGVLS